MRSAVETPAFQCLKALVRIERDAIFEVIDVGTRFVESDDKMVIGRVYNVFLNGVDIISQMRRYRK